VKRRDLSLTSQNLLRIPLFYGTVFNRKDPPESRKKIYLQVVSSSYKNRSGKMSNIPLTIALVNDIKTFLIDGTVPDHLALSTKYKFKARYSNDDWQLVNDDLKYKGKTVVPTEKVQETLERLYVDPLYTQQSGPRFWNRISTEFANISRSSCTRFLADKRVIKL
jgi:hypothetical protein